MKIFNLKQTAGNGLVVADQPIINKIIILHYAAILLSILFFTLSGCGGSGSSDNSDDSTSTTTTSSSSSSTSAMSFTSGEDASEDSFNIVILPDPQNYSNYYPETYYAQANWIVDNASSENIKFVLNLGDYVEDSTTAQWSVADAASDILDDASIPYCATIGNHDYETDNDPERDSTKFNQYFGQARFNGKSWYGGGYPEGKNDSSYYFFEADDLNFLVISLEYAPRKDTLAWAAEIVNAYPDHRVIIVTHGYTWTTNDAPIHANLTTYYDLIGSDGTTMFNEFISRYSNIFMVVSGHAGGDSVRSITANDGHTIYEVLVDYQYDSNGGNGWFKTMEFSPSADSIVITPQTVLSGVSTFSATAYYSSDPDDHIFELSYDMTTTIDFVEDIVPVGFNDRTINSTTSGNQTSSRTAGTPSGYTVSVWEDDSDDDGNFNIKMRGFTLDGIENFEEATVNSNTNGTHLNPAVAVDSSGDVVVVWQDDSDGDGYYDIKMSGYTIDGECSFSNYTVNSDSDGQDTNPSVAVDSTGNFVVVWQDYTNSNYDIYMKGFTATGSQYFSQRTANSTTAGKQLNPDVDVLSDGNFIVVWEDDHDSNNSYDVYMRGFALSGSAAECISERTVSADAGGQQLDPAICRLTDGGFAVAWEDDNDSDGYYEIYLGGFDSTGSRNFIQAAAGTESDSQQYNPAIASDENGNFAVTWQDDAAGDYDIMTRAFDQSGDEIMEELQVNKDPSGLQTTPDVTLGSDGRVVILWTDDTDSDGYYEIIGRGAYDFAFETYYGD